MAPEAKKIELPHLITPRWAQKYPSLPYIIPFAVFFALLTVAPYLDFLGALEYPVRVIILTATLFLFSRQVIDLRVHAAVSSSALGVAVFVIWIAPDLLVPGWRDHWLFQNALTGQLQSSLAQDLRSNSIALFFAAFGPSYWCR
ncbi:MAG: hypothetical protein WKF37_11430 [Bryobacteraceae bacterium]